MVGCCHLKAGPCGYGIHRRLSARGHMRSISTREGSGEVHRNQPVRCLCRADVVDDGLSPGWRRSDCVGRCPFWLDAIRSSRATPSAPRCGSEGVDAEVLWRLPNRLAILRRPRFVSRRFQCRMTASGATPPRSPWVRRRSAHHPVPTSRLSGTKVWNGAHDLPSQPISPNDRLESRHPALRSQTTNGCCFGSCTTLTQAWP